MAVKFSCEYEGCDYQSAWKNEVKRHFDVKHSGIEYKCSYNNCNYKNSNKKTFNKHVDSEHLNWPKLSCKYENCDYKVRKPMELEQCFVYYSEYW